MGVMRAILAIVAMAAGAAALAPAEVRAGSGIVDPLYSSGSHLVGVHNDLLTGLLIALGCALFSVVLRRLPSG